MSNTLQAVPFAHGTHITPLCAPSAGAACFFACTMAMRMKNSPREFELYFDSWDRRTARPHASRSNSHFWDDNSRPSFFSNIPAQCRSAGNAPAPGSRITNTLLASTPGVAKNKPGKRSEMDRPKPFWLLLHHERQASDCGWVKPCRLLNGKVRRKSRDQLHTPSPRAPKRMVQEASSDRGFLLQPGTGSPWAQGKGAEA